MRRQGPLADTRTVTIYAAGLLQVQWPNGQLLHHRASPNNGYDLCYSARPGDPVTLFTAREGLGVDLGGGVKGTLRTPSCLYNDGVEWLVTTDHNPAGCHHHHYLVKRHGSERLGRLDTSGGPPFSGSLRVSALDSRVMLSLINV